MKIKGIYDKLYVRSLHLVWLKFLPHHIPGSPNSDKIHRNNIEKLRHKERYTVSKAQRITAIFTTEKLTYSTILYSTTKGTKGLVSYLSQSCWKRQQKEIMWRLFNISHDTLNLCVNPNITQKSIFPFSCGTKLKSELHTIQDHAFIFAVFFGKLQKVSLKESRL